tara:strand:- start:163 stop:420 length:258 start_codon:yes stop_codon:yes gene_type:complete
MIPEIYKKVNSRKIILKYGNDYILLSQVDPEDGGPFQHMETLAFLCDENGTVSNWTEVAGGSFMQISDVITEISQYGITKRGAYQ